MRTDVLFPRIDACWTIDCDPKVPVSNRIFVPEFDAAAGHIDVALWRGAGPVSAGLFGSLLPSTISKGPTSACCHCAHSKAAYVPGSPARYSHLSLRDLAEMFLTRGFIFSYEAVRDWEAKLTPTLSENLRRRRKGRVGPSWYIDET